MDSDYVAILRADIAVLRNDVSAVRQDIGVLEAKSDALEAWRIRYLLQEDQTLTKVFTKVDELVEGQGNMRADLARIRGERDAERRTSLTIVSLLSAACGGLMASFFHG
jgi:hypothetical protein